MSVNAPVVDDVDGVAFEIMSTLEFKTRPLFTTCSNVCNPENETRFIVMFDAYKLAQWTLPPTPIPPRRSKHGCPRRGCVDVRHGDRVRRRVIDVDDVIQTLRDPEREFVER